MGLIVGSLCFVGAVFLLISTIVSSIPNNNNMQRLDTEETGENGLGPIDDHSVNSNTSISVNSENNFVSNN